MGNLTNNFIVFVNEQYIYIFLSPPTCRNDIDRYVNQLRRRKVRLGSRKVFEHFSVHRFCSFDFNIFINSFILYLQIKSQTPVSKENFRIIQSKAFDFDTNSSAQKPTTTESENCDDENYEDYYWSDIE